MTFPHQEPEEIFNPMNDLLKTPEPLKIHFELIPDEDGYPPVGAESLWAKRLSNGNFELDNIPFYVYEIASGDEISAEIQSDGKFWFSSLIRSKGNSVFRIIVNDDDKLNFVRQSLLDLGCPSEVNQHARLIALEVVVDQDISPLLRFLMTNKNSGYFDFEEGVLRHLIPDQIWP
jgi:hypothetical protein